MCGIVVFSGRLLLLIVPLLCASAEEPILSCNLHETHNRTGGGCCDQEPPVCDHFIYTYDADCWGLCPIPELCEVIAQSAEPELVYWYQDCWGDCSHPLPPISSCKFGETVTSFEYVPTACECEEAGPAR
jgi:hypothetical protein